MTGRTYTETSEYPLGDTKCGYPGRLSNIFGQGETLTPHGVALQALHQKLLKAWSKETTVWPENWSPARPSIGQCAITALLVHSHVGGMIIRGVMDHEDTHYWNISSCGEMFDLTRDQFTELRIVDVAVADVNTLLLDTDTCERYMLLFKRLSEIVMGEHVEKPPFDSGWTPQYYEPPSNDPPAGGRVCPSGAGGVEWQDEAGDVNFEVTTPTPASMMDALVGPGLTVGVVGDDEDEPETYVIEMDAGSKEV